MKSSLVKKAVNCRVCNSKELKKILSLGSSPLANSFLKKSALKKNELFYPLVLNFCKRCSLVQLADIVNPEVLFKEYLYVSSTSRVFINHFEKFASEVYTRFSLNNKDLVVDIGSNDGILLKPFKKLGSKVLGVDPAENVARVAEKGGIETIIDFFNQKVAKRIVKKYGMAKIITGANVFAHIDDWVELTKAVKILLKDDGIFIIEVPYLLDFLQKNLFDTIYHEHLSYISVRPLVYFFEKNNMSVFDIQKVSSHGGSIRVFVKKPSSKYKIGSNVNKCLMEEKKAKLNLLKTYKEFSNTIEINKSLLVKMLNEIKGNGKRIVGYGAPAKGNTLLNYFGIGPEIIDYIVDDSPLKQNLYTPGTHIRVLSPSKLKSDRIEYLFILAWNFADTIIENNSYLRKKGVKFIIPVPTPRIVT